MEYYIYISTIKSAFPEEEAEAAFKPGGKKPYKPGGPAANHRMEAATCLVIHAGPSSFAKVKDAWFCCLSVRGQIYRQTNTQRYVVSLGANKWCAFAYEWCLTSSNGVDYLVPSSSAPIKTMYMFTHDDSEWVGVQVEPMGPGCLPVALCEKGVMLAIVREVGLIKLALLSRASLLRAELFDLCAACKISVTRLPGEKYITMRSACSALVHHHLPEEPETTKESIVADICGTKRDHNSGGEIAHLLGEGCGREFTDDIHGPRPLIQRALLKPSLTVTAGDRTPSCLKCLLPPAPCNIAWQKSETRFNGYYYTNGDARQQKSTGRRYDGRVANRSMESALWLTVKTLWDFHLIGRPGEVMTVSIEESKQLYIYMLVS